MATPNSDKKLIPVTSPIKGVNTVINREGQTPDTCWNAVNMLPFDRYGRKRVSQRPGVVEPFPSFSGGGFIQNLLAVNDIIYPAQVIAANGSGAQAGVTNGVFSATLPQVSFSGGGTQTIATIGRAGDADTSIVINAPIALTAGAGTLFSYFTVTLAGNGGSGNFIRAAILIGETGSAIANNYYFDNTGNLDPTMAVLIGNFPSGLTDTTTIYLNTTDGTARLVLPGIGYDSGTVSIPAGNTSMIPGPSILSAAQAGTGTSTFG